VTGRGPPVTAGDLVVSRHGCRFRGRVFPCAIGRGGIRADKREGDGASPAGTFHIATLHYRADRVAGRALPRRARPIRPRDGWCDDPGHADYNCPVRLPHPAGHERLHRPDRLYDILLTTDHNRPNPVPGRGSAIFLHLWRAPRHPTAGCVAFRRADLLWIVARLTPRSRLVLRP